MEREFGNLSTKNEVLEHELQEKSRTGFCLKEENENLSKDLLLLKKKLFKAKGSAQVLGNEVDELKKHVKELEFHKISSDKEFQSLIFSSTQLKNANNNLERNFSELQKVCKNTHDQILSCDEKMDRLSFLM